MNSYFGKTVTAAVWRLDWREQERTHGGCRQLFMEETDGGGVDRAVFVGEVGRF